MHLVNLVAIATAALPQLAAAAAGIANINACIWMPNDPVQPITIKWKAGSTGDRCMSQTGTSTEMTVTRIGLTCISLGEVKYKNGGWDMCWTRASLWGLSYSGSGGNRGEGYSGSAVTQWKDGPWNTDIQFDSRSAETSICGSQDKCESTKLEWENSKTGNAWIIFRPLAVENKSHREL